MPEPIADSPLDPLTIEEPPQEAISHTALDVVPPESAERSNGLLSAEAIARLDQPQSTVMPSKSTSAAPSDNPEFTPDSVPKVSAKQQALSIIADGAVVLLLLVLGTFVGEFAAGQSTREVIAGLNGPKFPSLELLLWLAGPAVLVLIYVLLGSRQRNVGAWLQRRNR